MITTTTETPTQFCLYCLSKIDNATFFFSGKGTPAEGDYTICAYCGSTMVFGPGLRLQKPTAEELQMLQGDKRYCLLQKSVDEFHLTQPKPKAN